MRLPAPERVHLPARAVAAAARRAGEGRVVIYAQRVQASLRAGVRDVFQAVRVREGARRWGQLRACLARVGVGGGGGHAQRLKAELEGVRERLRVTQPARLVVLHAAVVVPGQARRGQRPRRAAVLCAHQRAARARRRARSAIVGAAEVQRRGAAARTPRSRRSRQTTKGRMWDPACTQRGGGLITGLRTLRTFIARLPLTSALVHTQKCITAHLLELANGRGGTGHTLHSGRSWGRMWPELCFLNLVLAENCS